MEDLKGYLALARATTLPEFVAKSDAIFLLKRPQKRAPHSLSPAGTTSTTAPSAAISYDTQSSRLEVDPFAHDWRIAPVRKREGNPYPDRISIGRATNCDVVIRMPSISKVQAHILVVGPDSFALRDNQSSNSTFVNGRRLEPKTTSPLHFGDLIAFGSLDLEFVDAERLYQILLSEVVNDKSPSMGPAFR